MAFWSIKKCVSNVIFRQSYTIFRYVRNVSRRGGGHKLLEGTVKTLTPFENDEYSRIENYKDFLKKTKSLNLSELDIEETFTKDEDFNFDSSKSSEPSHESTSEHKRFIKKKIIGRKYVKMEKETNLLTYAAKMQIRYLHKTNPDEWIPEVLCQHFPITVPGVKKLLKNNFILTSTERIKAHDEEVAKRWEALESGKPTELVSLYTQSLWDKGKIIKRNYQGNPNFPSAPTHDHNKITLREDRGTMKGEFSAIIEQYIHYKKKKELPEELSSSNELKVIENSDIQLNNYNKKNKFNLSKERKKFHMDDKIKDTIHDRHLQNLYRDSQFLGEEDVLHTQFKDNLKDEKHSEEMKKWIQEQSQVLVSEVPNTPPETGAHFVKIPKHRNEFLNAKRAEIEMADAGVNQEKFKHNKNIKRKMNLPTNLHKRNALHKVGKCVYNEYGELLYKLPS